MRLRWMTIAVLAFLGCESVRAPTPQPPPPVRVAANPVVVNPVAAIRVAAHDEPPPLPAPANPDSLTLAAECLERGDRTAAAVHLEAYVREHPEQLMFRAQLAELLVRLGKDDTAKVHFELFATDAQRATGAPKEHLVQVHTRLMEIAQRAEDRFGEAFHRGAGLLLLVKQLEKSGTEDEGFREEMLCKSLKSLTEAKALKPADSRVRVCLAEVYDRTGNRRAADAERATSSGAVIRLP